MLCRKFYFYIGFIVNFIVLVKFYEFFLEKVF